jgi:hypothetical protein
MKTIASRTRRKQHSEPFWLPAIGFYFIIFVLAAATFVFVIGLSTDVDQKNEWVTAGFVALGVIISGIVLRELILRNVRERRHAERDRLDRSLRHSTSFSNHAESASKFTLEKNAAALENIKRKSEAANVFGRISEGHREVFELCDEYRSIVESEIPNVRPGSPRLEALSKGSALASELHRRHMLRWAELETRTLSSEAQVADSVVGKRGYAQRAKATIDFALSHYPHERALRESADVLDEVILSLDRSDTNGDTGKTGENVDLQTVAPDDIITKKKKPVRKKKRDG